MKIQKIFFSVILSLLIILQFGFCIEADSIPDNIGSGNNQYANDRVAGDKLYITIVDSQVTDIGNNWQSVNNTYRNNTNYVRDDMVIDMINSGSQSLLPNNFENALNEKFGEGNWSIDFEGIGPSQWSSGISGNDPSASENNAFLTINVNKISEVPIDSSSNVEHLWSGASEDHVGETHLSAVLYPDRRNYSGKESLYSVGDIIQLFGNNCKHSTLYYDVCTQHKITTTETYEELRYSTYRKKWVSYTPKHYNTKTETTYESGCGGTKNSRLDSNTYPVNIEFIGFKVNGQTSITCPSGSMWNTGALKITEINTTGLNPLTYDFTTGTYFGQIKVTCDCCQGTCLRNFDIYFGDPGPTNLVDLTVKVTPKANGNNTVVSGYMDKDRDDKVDKEMQSTSPITDITMPPLRVVAGNNYKIESEAGSGHEYKWLVTNDGNVIANLNPYDYTMPPVASTIIAHFTPIKQEGYNLYITSNEGGHAYTEDRPGNTIYEDIKNELDQDIGDKFSNVKVGTEFNLKYQAKEGYVFDRWEYRPFIKDTYNHSDDTSKITMPHSDLTATAIFKKKPIVVTDRDPILKVTSNNKEWGTAKVIINGQEYSFSEVVNGIPVPSGTECEIIFESTDGSKYYFTNWEYDSLLSPFKPNETGIIVMPKYDLEITALFAPYPTTEKERIGGKVEFFADLIDGIIPGIVPKDLEDIAAGAEVTFGVTANKGYEFWYWYFKDKAGNIITPDNEYTNYGSGKFVMPNYDIEAHAVFKKVNSEEKELTILIEGEGTVSSDGSNIPNNTIISMPEGDTIELVATPADGWSFLHWIDSDGNILSEEEVFSYKVTENKTIIAVFTQNQYTLYITSMVGGEVWTDGNDNHPKDSIITTTDELGKTVYKIENVYGGEKFIISYSADDGYTFSKWEYKPYIKAEKDVRKTSSGIIEITMPNSDLTVTAVFKINLEDVAVNPKLLVTSNNKEWGSAHTTIDGKKTEMDKEYSAQIGDEYTLEYEAKEEEDEKYYFINWAYSTTKSPFISENRIKMPDYNLEVMALFAPLPKPSVEPSPDIEKHSVDFEAEPPEGGNIPEDLIGDKEIYPGSKVTIGVTPNEGWEFDYWYFKDEAGVIRKVKVHFEPDGSGYFIMPDYDVKAIAVFKRIGYKLYITYTSGGKAWVMNGIEKTVYIEQAIPEKIYELGFTPDAGYEFDRWEFRWDKWDPSGEYEGVRPDIYQEYNKAKMPYSDMTVTAIFKKTSDTGDYKLRVISNNYIWGNAWVYINGEPKDWKEVINGVTQQNASSESGIVLEANKNYDVGYIAEEGFVFTNWIPEEFFVSKNFGDKEGSGTINISEEALKDIDLTAYFKPGAEKEYRLTVKVETSDGGEGGTINGGNTNLKAGAPYYVNVEHVNNGYEFQYWYYRENTSGENREVIISSDEEYEGKMPAHDLELIAYFETTGGPGDNPVNPPTDPKIYYIIVEIEGEGKVEDNHDKRYAKPRDQRQMADGESIFLTATPSEGYNFAGWERGGGIVSTNLTEKFTINGESITVKACFVDKQKINAVDGLKIISVRDLRWKDYFVNGNSLRGNVFNIPLIDTTVLQKVNNHPDVLKMGYAVEFELITSQLKRDKAVLVITPKLIGEDDEEISWDHVYDGLTMKPIGSEFRKIIIYGDDKQTYPSTTSKTYQTSIRYEKHINNGIDINRMIWNWLYYLPGYIIIDSNSSDGIKNNYTEEEITVRFNIDLHETNDTNTMSYVEPTEDVNGNINPGPTLRQRLVKFEEIYSKSEWKGDVYKYSMKKSLFDDIYDNAAN